MLEFDVSRMDMESILKFSSTYPAYLKLWRWTTKNTNKFTDIFPEFKKWNNVKYENIFQNNKVNEKFAAEVRKLAEQIYVAHPHDKKSNSEAEFPLTNREMFIAKHFSFYYLSCSSNVVLCNLEVFKNKETMSNSFDYIPKEKHILKSNETELGIKYVNGICFINTYRTFKAYSNIIGDYKDMPSKDLDAYFYKDFIRSYSQNTIDCSKEWHDGCKTVIDYQNKNYCWNFIQGTNGKLVIITGFRRFEASESDRMSLDYEQSNIQSSKAKKTTIETIPYAGGVYSGEMVNNLPHGFGRCIYMDGKHYEGQFKEGLPHGNGAMIYVNGEVYEGEWKVGLKEGQGKSIYASGDVYQGDFKAGLRHGKGRYAYASGDLYEGESKNGNPDGQGRYTYVSGTVYEGGWKDGMQNGRGKSTYANGDRYEGESKDGYYTGMGKLTYSDGRVLIGCWLNNKFVEYGDEIQILPDSKGFLN